MNDLIPLQFYAHDVRMVMRDEQPWWVLNDVCQVLDLANPRDAATRLDDDEKGVLNVDTPGGEQEMTIVNESGLYSLIFASRKPEAKQFRRWVTNQVLPSIRKYGCYLAPNVLPTELPVDDQKVTDGLQKTLGQRFKEERLRWEAENGRPMAGTIPLMRKNIITAIEQDLGGIRKGERALYLLYYGIDVLYVLTGHRTLTAAERTLRDAYRLGTPEQRQALLARAQVLRLMSEQQ